MLDFYWSADETHEVWSESKLNRLRCIWSDSILLQTLGKFSSRPAPAPPLWQSDLSPHFVSHSMTAAWSLWAVCQAHTRRCNWFNAQVWRSTSDSTRNIGDAFGGLTWVWEQPLSWVPHRWIIHASHHASHAPAYVMSATRGESYVCMSVYVDVFISRPGLRERWLILFALYFYPPIYPPTRLFLRRRRRKERVLV